MLISKDGDREVIHTEELHHTDVWVGLFSPSSLAAKDDDDNDEDGQLNQGGSKGALETNAHGVIFEGWKQHHAADKSKKSWYKQRGIMIYVNCSWESRTL